MTRSPDDRRCEHAVIRITAMELQRWYHKDGSVAAMERPVISKPSNVRLESSGQGCVIGVKVPCPKCGPSSPEGTGTSGRVLGVAGVKLSEPIPDPALDLAQADRAWARLALTARGVIVRPRYWGTIDPVLERRIDPDRELVGVRCDQPGCGWRATYSHADLRLLVATTAVSALRAAGGNSQCVELKKVDLRRITPAPRSGR